jgi:squalene-hopene/tetraprenyl-beta-curcumene cyclase
VKGPRSARRLGLSVHNAYYPDLDDTAVVVMAMDRTGAPAKAPIYTVIARGREWIEGMQSRDGGWAFTPTISNITSTTFCSPIRAMLSADRRRHRPLSMLAQLGATAQNSEALAPGHISPDPACGGVVVRPLGPTTSTEPSVLCAPHAQGDHQTPWSWANWLHRSRTDAGASEDTSYRLD